MPTPSRCKSEERLNLCVPGGKDTTRMLKKLYAEIGAAPRAVEAPAAAEARAGVATARRRSHRP